MRHTPVDHHQEEYTFGRSCARLRKAMRLTQRELGQLMGVSEQTIQSWEHTRYLPTYAHMKQLLILCAQRHAFSPGNESEEATQFWLAARQQVPFPVSWIQGPSGEPSVSFLGLSSLSEEFPRSKPGFPSIRCIDWGNAPDVSGFYGREAELLQLEHWIVLDRCRVVSILGMGGIGKSALGTMLMYQVASDFQCVIFRSVRNAPLCQDLLTDCLRILSPQLLSSRLSGIDRLLDLLLECFQAHRCLLVLDNFEALLQDREHESRYLPGYEDYGKLLQRVAELSHQSCLLLTSREMPVDLIHREGRQPSLRLAGLEKHACKQLCSERGLTGTAHEQEQLIDLYEGNPLALKIVADTVVELFGGNVGAFLDQGEIIFSGIRDLLDEQFTRLSPWEQLLLTWLAIAREPLTIAELLPVLTVPLPEVQVQEALEMLHRRSLVERGKQQRTYTLQSVVLQYVTEKCIDQMVEQVQHGVLDYLSMYALKQANVKEYIRRAQNRLIVAPIILRLRTIYHHESVIEQQLRRLLDRLRTWKWEDQGYGPANVMALWHTLHGNLRNIDLSHLSIRGAYLQGVEMQDTSLVDAALRETIFTEAFDANWEVVISKNGQYWAAGSRRGEVRVWREGGQHIHRIWQAHADTTYTLAFSPDERLLATGSWDGTMKLWDLQSGMLLWTGRHTDMVRSVAFAPDGCTLASAGGDALIKLWDVASGQNVETLRQPDSLCSMVWSPDGRLLACGSFAGNIHLWHMQNARQTTAISVLTGHTNWVSQLTFAPDSTRLASASWDGTVKLWDMTDGGTCQTLTGHTERVYTVAWSPDGRLLASAGFDEVIRLWDIERNQYRASLHGHSAVVYSVAFTPDSRRLISGSEDSTLRVWDIEQEQCVHMMQGYAVSFQDLDWSPDGTKLVSGSSDMLVTIWDMAGNMQPRVLSGHRWTVNGVEWSPNGRLLASCGSDNAIRIWELATGACLQILQDPDYDDTIFQCLAWSPDGRLLACGSYLRGVQVWDRALSTRRWVGEVPATRVRSVAWSPDGMQLASCSEDSSISLWEGTSGMLLKRLGGHRGGAVSVAWSPDGTRLASGGGRNGGELFLWNASTWECQRAFPIQGDTVVAVTWSSDGERLISGGSDGSIHWWNTQSGECLATQQAHQGAVQVLKVSPDGRLLASSGDDSSIRLWDMAHRQLVRTLRRDRPYERLNITGITGLTEVQKSNLRVLGAFEDK